MPAKQIVSAHVNRSNDPINKLVSKIGGKPFGFLAEEWPECEQCHRKMDFIAQLDLKRPIHLSDSFRFAYLFVCNGGKNAVDGEYCDTYDTYYGANQIMLVDTPDETTEADYLGIQQWPEFLMDFVSYVPPADYEEESTGLNMPLVDLMVEATEEGEPDEDGNYIIEVPEGMISDAHPPIQIGGEPVWLQEEEPTQCPMCEGPVRFIGQIDSEMSERRAHKIKGADTVWLPFGSGIAYAFICEDECSPMGALLLYQRT